MRRRLRDLFIGLSPVERQRIRRAEDRALPPAYPRKQDCPGCLAARAADHADRWPVGDCGPTCARRAARMVPNA